MAGNTRTLKVVIAGDGKGAIRAFESVDGAARKSGDEAGRFGGRAGGAFGAAGGAALKFAKVAAVGTAAVAVGAGLLGKKIYDISKGYEQTLNVIKALDPSLTVARVTAALEGQSGAIAKLGYSTGDAAIALRELVKAGMPAADAMKAYSDTLVLARAGGIEVADAATAVSTGLNVFKDKAGSAANVVNLLAGAANESSAEVGSLVSAFQMSSAVAASAGLSYSDTAAALAILSKEGMDGSDAGTSLKTMLLRLMTPIGDSQKALKSLGVAVYDATGTMRPFRDIIGDLEIAMRGKTDAEKAAIRYAISGTDAVRSSNILITDGAKKWDAMTAAINRDGQAMDVAKAKTEGLSGAIARIKAIAESAGQKLYMAFAPAIGAAINGFIDRIGALGGAFRALANGDAVTFGSKMKELFGGDNQTAKFFRETGASVLDAASKIKSGLSGASNDSGFFSQAGEKIRDIWGTIKPLIGQFVDWAKSTLGPFFIELWERAQPALEQLKATFLTALDAIKVAINVAVAVIKAVWSLFGGFLVDTIMGFLNGALTYIKGALTMLQGIFNVFIGIFTGDWGRVWEGVKQIASGTWDQIKGLFEMFMNWGLLSVLKKGVFGLLQFWRIGWNAIKEAPIAIWNGIKYLFEAFLISIKTSASIAFSGLKALIVLVWNGIKAYFSVVLLGIRTVFSAALTVLKALWSAAWNAIKAVFTAIWGSIKGSISAIPGQIKAVFNGAKDWLKSAGSDIINGLVQGIKAALDGALDTVKNAASAIADAAKGALGINSPSTVFRDEVGKWIPAGIAEGVSRNMGPLESQMRNLDTITGTAGTGSPLASAGLAGSAGGAGAVTLNATVEINMNGSGSSDPEQADRIKAAVQDALAETVREIRSGRR